MLTWENDMEVHAVRKHGWSLLELPDPPRSWGSGVTGMAFDRLANVCKTGLGPGHRIVSESRAASRQPLRCWPRRDNAARGTPCWARRRTPQSEQLSRLDRSIAFVLVHVWIPVMLRP